MHFLNLFMELWPKLSPYQFKSQANLGPKR